MEQHRTPKPRVQFMNYLNILACFAVICLHSSQVVFQPTASITWHWSVLMQCLFIFAVPIFFMISGANLLGYNKRYTTKDFFKKRFRKTFTALLLGSILVYGITCFCPELFNRIPRDFSIPNFLALFLNNQIEIIYWFFYVILTVYIITPILSPLANSKRKLGYSIIVLALITSVLPIFSRYIPSLAFIQSLFGAQALTGGLMFFLLGYYLQNYVPLLQKRFVCIAVFLICTICMIVATLAINLDSIQKPGIPYEGFFANAFSLFSIGSSGSLFMLLKSFEASFQEASPRLKNTIQLLSSASLGVYIIHLLVMDNISYWAPHPWSITMTIEPFAVYVIAVTIAIAAQAAWKAAKRALSGLR